MQIKIKQIQSAFRKAKGLLLAAVLLLSLPVWSKDNVLITEIMYDSPLNEQTIPGTPSNNGEFIELYNAGVDPVNLSGWVLRGGSIGEVVTFNSGITLAPKSYLIVAYQFANSGFTLDQLYTGLTTDANRQVMYQQKIILSNSGEAVYLRDNNGLTKDSVYYDGTSSSTYAIKLRASNATGLAGNSCASIQRKTAVFTEKSCAVFNRSEWMGSTVSLFQQPATFQTPALPGVINTSFTSGQNYILTVSPVEATSQVDIANGQVTLHNDARGLVGIQYFDGLGRPTETVQQGITPLGADLVSMVEYDGVGRESKKWLPGVLSGNKGAFVDPVGLATNSKSTNADDRPYTETKYEASPLNRVIQQIGTGSAWEQHPATIDYQTNEGSEVRYYYVTDNNELKSDGNYAPASLYKTKAADEDGKVSYEYKDKQGKVVLKRSINGAESIDTYYVYDDLDRLRFVLPSLAADALGNGTFDENNIALKQYGYLYRYDGRGNCIYKRLPGCMPIFMVYDKANRLVLSQDGNQRKRILDNKAQWTVTKYDALGRVVFTGLIYRSETDSIESYASIRNVVSSVVINESYSDFASATPLTISYYDNYSFLPQGSPLSYNSSMEQNGYTPKWNNATGLVTGTQVYLLDGSGVSTTTVMYYDDKGHVVQNRATNHLGGTDLVYNQYDFTGKALKTLKEHSISGGSVIPELYRNEFDFAGRLLKTYYSINNKPEVLLVDNSAPDAYDELGRLRKKKRHNGTDAEEFDYNIRNWATRIKSGTLEEKLYYTANPAGATPCFNGNICYSTVQKGTGDIKGYMYDYDQLNRLLNTDYALNHNHSPFVDIPFYSEHFTYDKMGNIKSLRRYDDVDAIDQLGLYYNGNQVKNVDDIMGSRNEYHLKEYQNKAQNGANINVVEMSYDPNGNLIKDLDRDIVTIRYNVLNLPELVQFKNGNVIINKYDASAAKLKTYYYTRISTLPVPLTDGEIIENIQSTAYNLSGTAYVGNIEYSITQTSEQKWGTVVVTENYNFNKLQTSECYITGAVVPDINNYREGIQYNYFRKDHLGNVREVWRAAYAKYSGDVAASTIQQTQYYPSGLPWREGDDASVQNKKYNGKEFVEMHGYDTYDYGARGMYAAIGRFSGVDPLAEKFPWCSPYVYCNNNPIKYIDPTGMSANPVYGTDGEFLGTDNEGLQGKAIIMKKEDFTQGMKHEDAVKKDLAPNGGSEYYQAIDNYDGMWHFYFHYNGLKNRPDYDGFVTIKEGIDWAKSHPGALQNPTPDNTLYLDASKLDFGNITVKDLKNGVGKSSPINLNTPGNFASARLDYILASTVYALGRVNLILLNGSGEVSIVNDEATDYDWNRGGSIYRKTLINYERWSEGLNDTHGFKTFWYGVGRLKK